MPVILGTSTLIFPFERFKKMAAVFPEVKTQYLKALSEQPMWLYIKKATVKVLCFTDSWGR